MDVKLARELKTASTSLGLASGVGLFLAVALLTDAVLNPQLEVKQEEFLPWDKPGTQTHLQTCNCTIYRYSFLTLLEFVTLLCVWMQARYALAICGGLSLVSFFVMLAGSIYWGAHLFTLLGLCVGINSGLASWLVNTLKRKEMSEPYYKNLKPVKDLSR